MLGEKGGRWMKWHTGEEKAKQKQRRIIEQNVKKAKKQKTPSAGHSRKFYERVEKKHNKRVLKIWKSKPSCSAKKKSRSKSMESAIKT